MATTKLDGARCSLIIMGDKKQTNPFPYIYMGAFFSFCSLNKHEEIRDVKESQCSATKHSHDKKILHSDLFFGIL